MPSELNLFDSDLGQQINSLEKTFLSIYEIIKATNVTTIGATRRLWKELDEEMTRIVTDEKLQDQPNNAVVAKPA
jgi:hypothetical protein